MPVRCAKCGEELLGAVNRCWRCGTTYALHADAAGDPPVRRPPVVLSSLTQPVHEVTDSQKAVSNVGSPFQDGTIQSDLPAARGPTRIRPADRVPRGDSSPTAIVAGIIAAVLGGLSILLANQIPLAAVVISFLALGMAIWGMYGRQRWVPLVAILLSLIGLGWGGVNTTVDLYIHLYGISPWQSEDAPVTAPEDDFDSAP